MCYNAVSEETMTQFVKDFGSANRPKVFELSNLNLCLVLLTVISDIFEVRVGSILDEVF